MKGSEFMISRLNLTWTRTIGFQSCLPSKWIQRQFWILPLVNQVDSKSQRWIIQKNTHTYRCVSACEWVCSSLELEYWSLKYFNFYMYQKVRHLSGTCSVASYSLKHQHDVINVISNPEIETDSPHWLHSYTYGFPWSLEGWEHSWSKVRIKNVS